MRRARARAAARLGRDAGERGIGRRRSTRRHRAGGRRPAAASRAPHPSIGAASAWFRDSRARTRAAPARTMSRATPRWRASRRRRAGRTGSDRARRARRARTGRRGRAGPAPLPTTYSTGVLTSACRVASVRNSGCRNMPPQQRGDVEVTGERCGQLPHHRVVRGGRTADAAPQAGDHVRCARRRRSSRPRRLR